MNIYLDQICVNASMTKQADTNTPKTEAMQTATIGAVGVGTGYLASKIGKAIPSIAAHSGKMAALIGGIGLAGDYAAVKINKRLEKTATDNKYLEKVAESYQVAGHSGSGRGVYRAPNMQLQRHEYHDYVNKVDSHTNSFVPLAGVVPGAMLGAHIHTGVGSRVMSRVQREMHPHMRTGYKALGAAAGYHLVNHIMKGRAHNKALEEMHMTHPALQHHED